MNKKGFISISVIYSFFIVFMMLLLFIVDGYVNNRSLIKKISAHVTKEAIEIDYCSANYRDKICNIVDNYDPETTNTIELTNGYLYHHDSTLANGANDGSYRYAGANPNNYVCFGSSEAECPATNLYRIIGIIPVDVVIVENDITRTERKSLYKIIKNDYITHTEIGLTSNNNAPKREIEKYNGPEGNQPEGNIDGFYWNEIEDNTWSNSTLNNKLNVDFSNYIKSNYGNKWLNKIEKVVWKVGGGNRTKIRSLIPADAFTNEVLNSGSKSTIPPLDGKTDYYAKIGLMYVSDYGYSAPSSAWNTLLFDNKAEDYSDYRNDDILANNWLYRGVRETTITRNGDTENTNATPTDRFVNTVFDIITDGYISCHKVNTLAVGVRPVFYLNEDVILITEGHAGTAADPYRISL